MGEADHINKWLADKGKSLDGRQTFRLSWSETQFETRLGTFDEYTDSGLFIRTFTGSKFCHKYSYLNNKWVLEVLVPPELSFDKNLPDSRRGSYEPLYVFQDKQCNPLPLSLKAVEYIVNFFLNADKSGDKKCRINNELIQKDDKMIEEQVESMDISPIANALHMREGIGYRKGKND